MEQPATLSEIAPPEGPGRYLNRQLSWLQFNRRVLDEAFDLRHPLLERAKFLAIFSSNLDEFFMVRVSGIQEQLKSGVAELSPDGLSPSEQLRLIKPIVTELSHRQHACWVNNILPELRRAGVCILDYAELDDGQRAAAARLFHEEIFPILTPLAFDPGHPFPHISNLSLNLAVVVHDPRLGERFARLKVPGMLPRLMPLPMPNESEVLVWVEQIIAAHLDELFPGLEVQASYPFKITRDGDVELRDDAADDLLQSVEHVIHQRQFGQVVRLTVDHSIPQRILDILTENLEIGAREVYQISGPLGLGSLMQLTTIDRPDLKAPPFVPAVPPDLATGDLFAAIRAHDQLLHHPFESFVPVVDLIRAAADDPHVLAIKQTLYRVGSDTGIVTALQRARERGKQVTVLVELKARFDEENNIEWAKQLEDAGVHVVYGLLGLKTHCKVALIVRRENDGLRRYVHLSTGNYNASTARLYTDFGLLTCDPDAGADASDLFNYLTGYSAKRDYCMFAVAPITLRDTLVDLIDREIEKHRVRGDGAIIFKMNSLTDIPMIDALYRAAAEGVQIDLIVRGVCCLRPGVPGLSETIRVRSIIGRFLEHSRLYWFNNGGAPEIYLSSADLMSRNLDRRVETFFPVRCQVLAEHLLNQILQAYLRDTANTHLLQPDGTYVRPAADHVAFDIQAALLECATRGAL
jgi:polyphosphate kinase